MGDIVSAQTALVEVKREGQKWNGYITQAWFRYLGNSTPEGQGGTGDVLHGNPGGAPTWSPVDLTADVTGLLPEANGGMMAVVPVARGGTGLTSGTSGGIPYYSAAATIASSGALTQYGVVTGGGAGGSPVAVAPGTSGTTLHANPTGPPFWALLTLNAFFPQVTGTLPVANGGTGTATSTGSGSVVLSSFPTLVSPTLSNPAFNGPIAQTVTTFTGAHLNSSDRNVVAVTAAATTILTQDACMFFCVKDATSGGMFFGTYDTNGIGVTMISDTTLGLAFSRSPGVGLQAAVTAGADPRTLSTWACVFAP